MILEPAALAFLTVLMGPRLLNVLYFRVCTCLYMCRERCGWGDDTGQCWESSSETFHLNFWGRVFLLSSKQASLGRLSGWQAARIYLSPPLRPGIRGTHWSASSSCGFWELALGSSCSNSRHFTVWAISPGLCPTFLLQPARAPENWVLRPLISLRHLPPEVLRSIVKWTRHAVSENSEEFSLKYRDFTVDKTVCLEKTFEHCENVSCQYTRQCNSNCIAGWSPGVISFSLLYNIL